MSPWSPRRACSRCRGTHGPGELCPVAAAREQARQAEKNGLFNSREWKALRARKLHNDPWCQCDDCRRAGVKVRAVDVDHIQSRERAPHLALVYGNLRSMAHGHHSRKTALEDGGFGR